MWTCRLRVWNVRQPRKSAHVFTHFSFRLRTNKCGELDFDVFTAAQLQWVFLKEARHTIQFNSIFVANSMNCLLYSDYDEWFTTVRLEVFKKALLKLGNTPLHASPTNSNSASDLIMCVAYRTLACLLSTFLFPTGQMLVFTELFVDQGYITGLPTFPISNFRHIKFTLLNYAV